MARRVAIVSPGFAPRVGGVERHVEALALGLVDRGVETEVITTDPSGRLPAVETIGDVTVRRFRTLANDGVYVIAPRLGWWLLRNAHRFDVLHAHSYHAPVALQAAIASTWARRPLVFTPHYHGTGHTRLQRALHVPYRVPGRWLVRQARRIVCVSRVEETLVRRHFGPHTPTCVIPNGVEDDEVRAAPRNAAFVGQAVVLSASRLEPYKRPDALVDALPFLPPEYKVVMVGEGSQRPWLRRRAEELGVGERLHLTGGLSRPELLGWFKRADAFVSLSRHESFGLTLLEAAVGGAPVLASDIPAHRETADYLPSGRVGLAASDLPPRLLARRIVETASLGRAIDTRTWQVPTWRDMSERALACYQQVSEVTA